MDKFPVANWLISTPLYAPLSFTDEKEAVEGACALLTWQGTLDSYCPDCGQMATFRGYQDHEVEGSLRQIKLASIAPGMQHLPVWGRPELRKSIICTRQSGHALRFYFFRRGERILKVGQFPSYADLARSETRQFAKVLGDGCIGELNKGIGLAAHGVGVGAFVYLRRVFESLVEEAHQLARQSPGWDDARYPWRMEEKIQVLAGHLPPFLVENHKLYSILSLHLHELSDEDCLANFELVKQGIFAIAEERLAERARQTRLEAAKAAIAQFRPPKQ